MRTAQYYQKQQLEGGGKWTTHICSICCLKSAGDFFGVTRDKSLYQLTMNALETGVFKEDEETGEISGAYHVTLVELAESLGLHGKVERRLNLRRLINLLNDGSLVMLSVDKSKIDSKLNGGHLILIHSYDAKSETFIVHDSEPVLADDGENVQVGKKQLEQISNQRGISLRKLS